ncbi:MAG: diaminopimelate decarboxylase [Ruminococcaceae bacterium]|nr:diaminopimelate decarboxylase [Oscillospiraceae bacterium]
MYQSESLKINEQGHLEFGGCDTLSLAKEYQTPLYVMDEQVIRNNCKQYRQSMEECYGGHGLVLYASKAFSCKEMYRIAMEEGLGVDVVSGGELYTALSVGFPAEKICFHGNNKTKEELEMAVKTGVGYIVVDSREELSLLNAIAGERKVKQPILCRMKPGIDAHTHSFVQTGHIDCKFGTVLENGDSFDFAKLAAAQPNLTLLGVHCHVGSQIFDEKPFLLAAERMMDFVVQVREILGVTLKVLNLGGGYGIRYTEQDQPIAYGDYMKKISEAIKSIAHDRNVELPFILMEPGRSIVGEAGITLYTVGSVKKIPDVRTFVSVDGGMSDNPRYILYQAEYEMLLSNKAKEEKTASVTVAGKCCESGDLLGENVALQEAKAGDILAVLSTGAYNYSMASNYNRIPRAAVVMVKDGASRVIVRRESYEDLIRNDV